MRSPAFAKQKPTSKYPDDVKCLVQSLLSDSETPRDSLPYTDEFKRLKKAFESERGETVRAHDFWMLLSKIGKQGGLATGGPRKKGSKAPKLSENEQFEILRLLPDGIGTRDHLPYSLKFDEMHRRFSEYTGRQLSKHEFWRALSLVAKNARKAKPVHAAAPIGELSEELVQFLEDRNPWWRGLPAKKPERFRRWAFDEMVRRLDKRLAAIVVIRGSRRVGKSVLQSQLVEELLLMGRIDPTGRPVDPSRILSVQFDDAPALGSVSMPIQAIVRWYERHILKKTLNEAAQEGMPAYLLFDEVQNLQDWSVQLKILADNSDARILVTGSSALRIGRGQDNLAGRMDTIEMGPLRLWEVDGIRGGSDLRPYAAEHSLEEWKKKEFWYGLIEHGERFRPSRDSAFHEFSRLGGYPKCHSTSETDLDRIRQQVINEVIVKTIEYDPEHARRTSPLEPSLIKEVFRMVCRYAGQAVRSKRLADELGQILQSPIQNKRVDEAVDFLENSLLIHRTPPLQMLAKKQQSPHKLCVCDHFVRNGFLQETVPIDPNSLADCDEAISTQAGHVIESIVGYFLRGIPGLETAWFPERQSEPEVDFVLSVGTTRLPVEIKYRRSKPAKVDLAGIEAFCQKKAYQARFGIVITQSHAGDINSNALAVPASTFLLLR